MARALENRGSDSTYLEFFGLAKPPFARLSQPSQSFQAEQYSLLMGLLANATAQTDCLIYICGADGSGKTTLLNRYIASLGDDIYFASIDDTCSGPKQFYCAFLRQLGFSDIDGTVPELRRITREFLVHRRTAGDSAMLLLDNAHLVNPTVLEQLRWISAIKVDDQRVLSVVLTGNSDLVRIMDSPAMSQSRFRSQRRFNIRAYTEEEIARYINHRLGLAGNADAVQFSKEAFPLISRYTGGTPSLINMLCNAVLTEAHMLESRVVTEELVRQVADNRQLLPYVIPLHDKGRRKTDADFKLVTSEQHSEERITARTTTPTDSDEEIASRPATPNAEVDDLLAQVAKLSAQLGKLRAERKRSLRDIRSRDEDIRKLRKKLSARTADTAELKKLLKDNNREIAGLKEALSSRTEALQKSKEDLEKLARLQTDLHATGSELEVALRLADERGMELDLLEKNEAILKDEVESKTSELFDLQRELDARNAATTDLEQALQQSREEHAAMLAQEAASNELEESVSERDACIANLEAELAAYDEKFAATEAMNQDLESRCLELAEGLQAAESESTIEESGSDITAFEIARGGKVERVVELAIGESRIMIGRSEGSELLLDSRFVSRHHALIHCTEQGLCIEDLNSFNGTLVNSEKIKRRQLEPGDVVMIGDFQLRPSKV